MGLEDLVGGALIIGGTIYVVDKITGKRKKVKIPRRAVKRSNIRKAVKKSPPKCSRNKKK